MTRKPPSRRGITFEVGARLEARDRLKKWYTAHIEKIDYEEGKVLIHFKRWNHRYDEWFNWDSVYLRPLERPLLRREGVKLDEVTVEFRVGEQVLACWSDCRFYPARVASVNKDATYTVEFYDGVVQTVKKIHVKQVPKYSRDQGSAWRRNKENGTGSGKRKEKSRDRAPPCLSPDRSREQRKEEETVAGGGEEEETGKGSPPAQASSESQQSSEQSSPLSSDGSKTEEKRKRGRPPSVGLAGQKLAGNPGQEQTRRRSLRLASGDSNSSAGAQSDGASGRTQDREEAEEAVTADPQPARAEQPGSNHPQPPVPNVTPSETSKPQIAGSPRPRTEDETATANSSKPSSDPKPPTREPAPVVKRVPRSQNPNRYSREPLTNSVKTPEDHLPPKALIIELDHNKFKCKIPECSKAFRKAKMLHYHMKYYHGMEKVETEPTSPKRSMLTRGACSSEHDSPLDSPKRPRTTSVSLHGNQTVSHLSSDGNAGKLNEKRRTSAPSSVGMSGSQRPSLREKSKDNQMDRSHRRQQDRERSYSETGIKERNKERKFKDFLKVKLKKKKKKKKKSKSEFSGSEENIDVSRDVFPARRATFPSTRSASSSSSYKLPFSHKYTCLRSSDSGFYREGLKVDDEDPSSDSSTDSLMWSEDEYSQDVDVTTNPDETGDGDESQLEIVRCVCEVEEENEFMIQCEECLCWQHGVCMGLLEDSVPDIYTCYICRDPPGQRLSSRYCYDKEWLNSGQMHGLSFLKENYSQQNSGKIVSTHQLLGDIHRVIELLHGLQLKMYILQNKDQPDLRLWCKPWRVSAVAMEKLRDRPSEDGSNNSSSSSVALCPSGGPNPPARSTNGTADRPGRVRPPTEESYITSEHCYQKPRAYYPAAEQRLVVETRNSALDERIGRLRENGDEALAERFGRNIDEDSGRIEQSCYREQAARCKARSCSTDSAPDMPRERESCRQKEEGEGSTNDPQLQWQVNLLTHIASMQDEVSQRMDFIERELDVLESWLDYSGELEPPDPLARLPQLKHRMKQLLADLGKVQQIASCCAV
uniref:C2H2-type domain-containing protein n=1 Tax=Callorhinchus milii TaxID=7868 RepID=A0A4W3IEM0_CALMI|eukprot:gi/632983465/ref/XP_007908660.1/ PREDICTED: PHD finger protein 20 isoform X1 [Callorhinchus milii]